MVNISKDLFNFFVDVIHSELILGVAYNDVWEIIEEKYGKYIDNNFDTIEFLEKIKKRE